MTTATHNVDIRFRETGARVIKRKIDEIGVAANSATRGIFLMQRALFVLGGAGILRALTRQLDTLTNYENRLRLTATSAANLEEVQSRLFQVARDSRTGFEAVADIYSRTALSVRELGISQAETLRFTESLSKATIISGASSREAHAALIQLGQGMASNTLRGDELRSVLEQLPFVADVIAESLGVTRGELRELGADGKISAETILEAFRNAEEEIDRLFANTVPTISQALSVANTNWLEFLDNIDDATNASGNLAKAIIVLSENLGLILGVLGSLALALTATFAGKAISAIGNYVLGLRGAALASTRLLEIENIRAATSVRNNGIAVAANAQRQVELTQRLSLLGIQKAQLQQTVLDTQFTVANGRARNISTGQFVGLATAKANLSRVTQQLSIVENAELVTAGRLAGARATQTAATTTATAANSRLAAAQAAQGATAARLTALFPTLAGAIGRVGVALAGLAAFIGPLGLIAIAVGAVVTAFALWGNEIKVTSDGVVGLKDFVVAAFQLMGEAIAPFATFLREQVGGAVTAVQGFFEGFGTTVAKVFADTVALAVDAFTFWPRVALGTIAGVVAAFKSLPEGAATSATALANVLIAGFEAFANGAINAINKVIGALNALLSFVGADKAAELFGFSGQLGKLDPVTLGRFESEYSGAGNAAAEAFQTAFGESFEANSFEGLANSAANALRPIGEAITGQARRNIDQAAEDALHAQNVINNVPPAAPTDPDSGSGSGGGSSAQRADFASVLSGMNQEIELLRLSNKERRIQEGILEIEKELKRGLTQAEQELAAATIESVHAAETQAQVLQDIIGPREEIAEQQAALNALFEQGRIGLNDYTTAIREMQVAADEAAGTLFGGFRAAINSAIMSASELGSALGDIVVGAADSAADAIVEFAKTGKLNVREFFFDLFAQITKLIAKQLILKALGGLFGGFAGGGSIGPSGGLGFAGGGSINASGPGSTDSQIVQFAKRPDERVDILTPGQQKAQRDNMNGGGGGTTVVQSPPVNVAAVLSPSDITGAFDSSEGETVVINILSRNASTVRQLVGG